MPLAGVAGQRGRGRREHGEHGEPRRAAPAAGTPAADVGAAAICGVGVAARTPRAAAGPRCRAWGLRRAGQYIHRRRALPSAERSGAAGARPPRGPDNTTRVRPPAKPDRSRAYSRGEDRFATRPPHGPDRFTRAQVGVAQKTNYVKPWRVYYKPTTIRL